MSEEYEDDFENCYEEDFESDGELEVPALQQQQQQHDASNEEDAVMSPHAAPRDLNSTAWPSLSTALQSPPSKGRRQAPGPPLFGRSLFAVDPALSSSGTWSALGASTETRVILQPPPSPPSDKQRRQAAAALTRARQLQQQVALHASTQLSLLVLQPLSLYQQYCQGVGVYAGRLAAACQTRQLGQEVCEQDAQTDQVEQQPMSCQVPEDLYSKRQQHQHQQQGTGAQRTQQQLAVDLLAASDPAFCGFLAWAVPQVLFELSRVEAEAAAGSSMAAAAAGPSFARVQTAQQGMQDGGSRGVNGCQQLLAGELQLPATGLLAGRPLVGFAGPPTAQAAAAAAAAVTAAAAATAAASRHLLLGCYGPVAMPAETAASEHGIAGMGCLCVWDLLRADSTTQGSAAAAAAAATGTATAVATTVDILPQGVLQLLVSEGRPTCCCWGVGDAACLVFAGMEEGGICCWDLSEPHKAHMPAAAVPQHQHRTQHTVQQQQQQPQLRDADGHTLPARQPSYSTEVPIFPDASSSSSTSSMPGFLSSSMFSSALTAGAIVALTAAPSSAASSYGSSGGAACRLLALTSSCCVALYSVMLGDAGSDVAVGDLGMRSGSRAWLVKVCEGLPLGLDVVKPPHMRRSAAAAAAAAMLGAKEAGNPAGCASSATSSSSNRLGSEPASAACLLVLPGATQQLLVGVECGRVLKGAALGVTTPPHEFVSSQWWLGPAAATASDTDAVPDAYGCKGPSPNSSSNNSGGWQQQCSLRGAVTSLSACTLLPELWAAGHSCGCVAVFSHRRSRALWLWQHPQGAAVVAVRWLPHTAALVALFSNSSSSNSSSIGDSGEALLLVFDLAGPAKQPAALAVLTPPGSSSAKALQAAGALPQQAPQPWSMEVLSCAAGATHMLTACCAGDISNSSSEQALRSQHSTKQQQQYAVRSCVAVGCSDGSSSVYQLSEAWCPPAAAHRSQLLEALQKLAGS